MNNWSVDEVRLRKYPDKYKTWKLEQLINFGLGNEKLLIAEVKKHIDILNIDPAKKKYLKFLLD